MILRRSKQLPWFPPVVRPSKPCLSCYNDVKANRTPSVSSAGLREGKGGIVAADATTDTGKGLTGSEVAGSATQTICITKGDDWRIREGST